MHDESRKMEASIEHTSHTDPPLAIEMAKQWELRSKVNAVNMGFLDRIEAMVGFSGVRGVGIRLCTDQAQFPCALCVSPAVALEQEQTNIGDSAGSSMVAPLSDPVIDEILAEGLSHVGPEDDEAVNELEGMTEFVCSIGD
jgi:hypothetical protein